MQSTRFFFGLLIVFFGQILLLANDANLSSPKQRNLDGKWLFESALLKKQDSLYQVWSSVLSISSDNFTISNFLDPSKELKGKIRFDEKAIDFLDLELEGLDFSGLGEVTQRTIPISIFTPRLNTDTFTCVSSNHFIPKDST